MPIGIALAVLAGGTALSAIGGSMQQGADDAAARDREATLAKFTGQQDAEFKRRQGLLTAGADRVGAIKDQSFASLNTLRGANATENNAITTKYSNAGTDAALKTADITGGINAARNTLRDASDVKLAGVTGDEHTRQQGYQAEGTDIAGRMIAGMGVGPNAGGINYYNTLRTDNLNAATAKDGTTATPSNVDPNSTYGRALAASSGSMVGQALSAAGGRAMTSSVGDAATNQKRSQDRAGERIDILGRKAVDSRGALDPEMTAAKMVRDNADKDATTRQANADADMQDYTKLLLQEQTAETDRTGTRQKAYDDLINQVADGSIKTEEDFIAAINNSSLNYEDAIKQLANFKMGGTVGSSFMGNLLSSAGGHLASAGASGLLA